MLQTILSDKLWLKLKPILLDLNIYDKSNLRNTFSGILYRLRTGCQWRYLPDCFGSSNNIFRAFRRWSKSGKLMKLFKALIKNPDMEWLSVDGTHIRAHHCIYFVIRKFFRLSRGLVKLNPQERLRTA